MNIHSTQNLNLVRNQQLSKSVIQTRDFRKKEYSEQIYKEHMSLPSKEYNMAVTFGAKKPVIRNGKKVIMSVKKVVGEISKNANPERKKGDGLLSSPHFNALLDFMGYETVITAAVAAIACAARASTILSWPTKANKEDNNYAAGQAGASGIIGIFIAFLISAPFRAGADHVMGKMKQHLSEKTLSRLYPHLDLKSIMKDGKRLPIKEWKDLSNNKFIDDMKECGKLPKLKNLADVSDKTFKNILKLDVDWASQKGKSFNDVKLRNGKNLYDEIDMSRLGIKVNEEGMSECQILLKDMNKVYLERLLECAREDGTHWATLDSKSVYDAAGKVKDFREWKDINGKQWKLDLDEIGISSPYETFDYKPRVSGRKRFDTKDGEYKFCTYQENGKDGNLGTEITNEMVDADRANDGIIKFLTWGPDILFRVPTAAITVAIIPWVMKNIFHLQKSSDKNKIPEQKAVPQVNINNTKNEDNKKAVNFKGGSGAAKTKGIFTKLKEKIGEVYGKLYGKNLIESDIVYNTSRKLSRLPGDLTEHMTALGSLITSGTYVHQTLTKKDIDPDRRRTLAINQALCFAVPTAAAYTVNKMIKGWVKNNGYRFSGINQNAIDIATIENKEIGKAAERASKLGSRLKGIRTLASITVFTMIYRYLTPVLITPLANKLGDNWNARVKARRMKEAEKLNEQQGKDSYTKVA